jgi:D-alanyl-lipoteichoic acid acyltransferase DltB (MBOAT superfamily)
MALNLGMLGYFKYYNFFAESLQLALNRSGVHVSLSHLNVVLPIGISFYTFQSMSYVIDVCRRDIKPTRNFVEFAAFVSFFPHLVAGPIMRPTTLLPQIETKRTFDLSQFYHGFYLIFWGLTKKVVVADNLALIVNDLFGKWQTIDGGLALIAIYAFAFQIYCDFSGYTDAARGIAKCLGIELALNFNLPYFATSPRDFWNRWHISLSTWLRDYLYITLGGNRGGKFMLYRNLMLTMIIGGLWHGAAWTSCSGGRIRGFSSWDNDSYNRCSTGSTRPTRSTAPAGRACGSWRRSTWSASAGSSSAPLRWRRSAACSKPSSIDPRSRPRRTSFP